MSDSPREPLPVAFAQPRESGLRPWIAGLASGIGVVLGAWLLLALFDVIHAGGAPLPILALWALIALPIALGTGIVLAGGNATWGLGWVRGLFRWLREDQDLDRK